MTTTLYPDLDRELASTRRLLERFPDGNGDWKPHEKSMSLTALANHVASLANQGATILTTDEMDVATRQRPAPKTTRAELLVVFDEAVARLRTSLASADAEHLGRRWTLRLGPKVLVSEPRSFLLRYMVFNHLVHHRAQLGVYFRLLGVPIPGMYGPSADEPL